MVTCADAVEEAVKHYGRVVSNCKILNYIEQKYPSVWKDNTVRTIIIGCSVNHSSSHHYKHFNKFIFTVDLGRVRLYNPETDGKWEWTPTGMVRARAPARNYNQVFLESLDCVMQKYRVGKIRFYSERDLQSCVFSECLRIMEEDLFRWPLKIYCERGVFSKRSKVDLVLGDDDVLVEFKLEPDYPGVSNPVVFSMIKEAGSSGSVELDLEKIDDYANKGKHAHFVMLDEDGKHARKIDGEWKEMTVRGKNRFWLQVYRKPTTA